MTESARLEKLRLSAAEIAELAGQIVALCDACGAPGEDVGLFADRIAPIAAAIRERAK